MTVSIIIATFNSGQTLSDTFDSILSQTWQDYECIVVDGASKDNTLNIIREYEPRFTGRMRWKSEPDKGIYDAMNKGIESATGDIVGLLNSDDFYTSSDVLSTVVRTFSEKADLDAIYGDVHYCKQNDPRTMVRYYSSKVFRRGLMRFGFMPAHPSFYARRKVYEEFGTFDTSFKIAADFDLLLRMIFLQKINTLYIEKDFVTMREGGVSSSGIKSHKLINEEHMVSFRKNGVKSNYFLLSLRYLYKIYELIISKLRRFSVCSAGGVI